MVSVADTLVGKRTKKELKLSESKKTKVVNALRKTKIDPPQSRSYSKFINKLIAASDIEQMKGKKE